ncbi:MAG: efflux RND transporter permease subunit [Deltaproteobacteria bacterium]|nr:efflux RND transporter permease subunit [Deltaproteobacteria bacterium]
MSAPKLGAAGRLARAFIHSKLTPLLLVASVVLGAFAVWRLPREEEPQIVVPMSDVMVRMPGASAKEVEERITKPLERLLWEIPGVEYVYSTSMPGMAQVILRFKVGEDEERSTVRLQQKLAAHADIIPPGASPPLVKPRSIDDVPVLSLTLWSKRYSGFELRRLAAELEQPIKQVDGVSEVTITGGERRQLRVALDPDRLAARRLTPSVVAAAVAAANQRVASGAVARNDRELLLETGTVLASARDVGDVVVGAEGGRPVFVRDVATIIDGPEEPSTYVRFGAGAAAEGGERTNESLPAVTVSIAKHKGENAVRVVASVMKKVETYRGSVIPADVEVSVTRDYGATASEKSNELLFHMAIAVVSVAILIWVALGKRESGIVMLAIPATLALTLTVFYLYGYTLNRITLFALIFSIGILVDDAIVVVENIARHARLPENRGRDLADVAVRAVDEVGNPTILATMTVIAAILPMAFVGGLMGPYMRPIPIGASAAMIFSLIVAFIVTPWATVRLLGHAHGDDEGEESKLTRFYRHVMGALLRVAKLRFAFLTGVVVLLVGAMSLVAVKWVKVKMLPFDNKSEFQVMVDMPEGTTLEDTDRVTQALADAIRTEPEVRTYQTYVGTSGPYNFNGLVRHYFQRRGSNVADIQVNLVEKGERKAQSHDIAKRVRNAILPIAARYGARIKVAEVPPGPPVLSTLVAEVYGPSYERAIEIARGVRDKMEATDGVVDVDWYVEDDQPKVRFVIDEQKAALSGVSEAEIGSALRVAVSGADVGLLHDERAREDVPIVLRLPRASRSDLQRLQGIKLVGRAGNLVSVGELVRAETIVEDKSIYHKNLMPVVYVTADIAGRIESPVYAITKLGPELDGMMLPEGYALEQYTSAQPFRTDRYAMKWDGEWHITYEVFRDLGAAFAAVLVLIYVLNVAWFQSFKTPLVIMSAIPFSLVGILPAHGMMGAFFTATSMIGFIAGAGIVVRNSIILVDFIEQRIAEGAPLEQAVVDAGAIRFRPMLLTAAAVVVGAFMILFDPIFQGLAIALMAGEIASLLLSRMTVPIVYFMMRRREERRRAKPRVAAPSAPEPSRPSLAPAE